MDRRSFLARSLATASLSLPASVARALEIDADNRSGSIQDVAHVVIFMQENRSFDHYFGALAGVRGFGDRFPIPIAADDTAGYRTVWNQDGGAAGSLLPFHLDTGKEFGLMRVEDTPHTWPDAQAAWDEGRLSRWPQAKTPRSMGHYRQADIPFQHALAAAFTLCDAYHCSMQAGTNPNRVFLWTGTNDGLGQGGGPAIGNSHDRLAADGGSPASYRWTSYVERLQAAGIDWRIYEDMADNYTDNPLAGFKSFRDAHAGLEGSNPELLARGLSTQALDRLKSDVLADRLPQVSYVISSAAASEHPSASSPAQGANYTAELLDALTSRPDVWSRTVLFLMFDENDGFFDHVPPPAPPSRDGTLPGGMAGASTVSTAGEYHLIPNTGDEGFERPELMGRPYGLGPRVPMYVISPWSRGGWVNSELFDHTSVIRFLEQRFGVAEPNISPWRRAVCGDLTSAFDFKRPNHARLARLPDTGALATRAAALTAHSLPDLAANPPVPVQAHGVRPSRALPYRLSADFSLTAGAAHLTFRNTGSAGAVFHVYDRRNLGRAPRRYTVEAGGNIDGIWEIPQDGGAYDLWILGPNGFHRHFAGIAGGNKGEMMLREEDGPSVTVTLRNPDAAARSFEIMAAAYKKALPPWRITLAPGRSAARRWKLAATGGWYDLEVFAAGEPAFLRRFAGRVETGRDSISDPEMGGAARLRQA